MTLSSGAQGSHRRSPGFPAPTVAPVWTNRASVAAHRRAVFLDRDGVLNRVLLRNGLPHPPDSVETFALLPGVADACDQLRQLGFLLIVASNQPDVARGKLSASDLDAINTRLTETVELDAIYCCLHDDVDDCACRKPRPGMLEAAALQFDLALEDCLMVGDRWRDIEAGRRAGCRTVFIDCDYAEPKPIDPDVTLPDLPGLVEWIRSLRRA